MKKSHHDRLYFIVRSYVMGCIGAVLLPGLVFILGSADAIQVFFLGIFVYIASLVISRAFDKQIDFLVMKALYYLDRYKKIKNFILKYF